MKKIIFVTIIAALSLGVQAATQTANFNATATLSANCQISSENMNFGVIPTAQSGTVGATTTITTLCNKGISYTVSSSRGSGIDYNNRSMRGSTGNADKLMYNLYKDDAGTIIWGEAGSTIPLTSLGVAQETTIYGKVNVNQYVKADTYTDTIVVTLNY